MTPARDRWLGAAAVLAGVGVIAGTRGLAGVAHGPVGPDLVPLLIGLGMVAIGVMVGATVGATVAARSHVDGVSPAPVSPREGDALAIALMLSGSLAWALLLEPLGFLVVTPPLLLALLWIATGRLALAVGLALGVTVLAHGVFAGLLGVPLPWGVLAPVAGAVPWI